MSGGSGGGDEGRGYWWFTLSCLQGRLTDATGLELPFARGRLFLNAPPPAYPRAKS